MRRGGRRNQGRKGVENAREEEKSNGDTQEDKSRNGYALHAP